MANEQLNVDITFRSFEYLFFYFRHAYILMAHFNYYPFYFLLFGQVHSFIAKKKNNRKIIGIILLNLQYSK